MDKQIATELVAVMRECSDKLNGSVQRVKDTCTEEEFLEYRRTIGKIMGEMYFDVMRPIFEEYLLPLPFNNASRLIFNQAI
jgi:hypothetical protein